jgi:hypothetical protein
MYAGSTDTLYISKDKGLTWTAKKIPGTGYAVNAIHIYNNRIYAGTDNGPYMSSDGGANWVPSNIHIRITSFAEWNGLLYSSTDGAGMFTCSPVSNTWTAFNQNYPLSYAGGVARLINTGHTLFAAAGLNGAGYRYDPDSSKWEELYYTGSIAPGMGVFDLMRNADTIFALNNTNGLMRSQDSGTTWTPDAIDMRSGIDGVVRKASQLYYVAWNTGAGAWIQSRDINAPAGSSWATGEEFLTGPTVYAIREYDTRLFLARNDGVYYKSNGSAPTGSVRVPFSKQVLIYPNPSQDGLLTIQAEGLDKLEVWDMSGKRVHQVINPATMYRVQLPAAGTYIIRLMTGDEVLSRRVSVR